MYCGKDSLIISTTQSYIFIFAALITFSTALVSDKIGRKKTFFIMIFVLLTGFIIAIPSNSLFGISTGVLLVWTSGDIFYSMALLFVNESSSNYLRSKVSGFFLIAAVGSISINGILLFMESYK